MLVSTCFPCLENLKCEIYFIRSSGEGWRHEVEWRHELMPSDLLLINSNKLLSSVDWLAGSAEEVLNYSRRNRRFLKMKSFPINSLAGKAKQIVFNFEEISWKFLSKSKFCAWNSRLHSLTWKVSFVWSENYGQSEQQHRWEFFTKLLPEFASHSSLISKWNVVATKVSIPEDVIEVELQVAKFSKCRSKCRRHILKTKLKFFCNRRF